MRELELVKSAKDGDKNAFADLYLLYNDRLYRYAFYKLKNEHDARDAVSSCIVEAFENIQSLKNEKAFSAWIFKIMYRCCCRLISHQMDSRSTDSIDLLIDEPATQIDYESIELSQALSKLTDDEIDLVLLSSVGGYTSSEIAKLTGSKPATVRTRLSRVLKKLRQLLE